MGILETTEIMMVEEEAEVVVEIVQDASHVESKVTCQESALIRTRIRKENHSEVVDEAEVVIEMTTITITQVVDSKRETSLNLIVEMLALALAGQAHLLKKTLQNTKHRHGVITLASKKQHQSLRGAEMIAIPLLLHPITGEKLVAAKTLR